MNIFVELVRQEVDYQNYVMMKMARWFIILGIILIIIGVILYLTPWVFKWFGHLPGDIRIEKENIRIYFPITSMIVISIILTLIVNLIRYFKSWKCVSKSKPFNLNNNEDERLTAIPKINTVILRDRFGTIVGESPAA